MIERRVWVIDTETTGNDSTPPDRPVELAGVLMEGSRIIKTYETLVNPGIPIPPTASAIHHLRDHDVADAISIDAAIQPLLEEPFDYAVAHSAEYDSKVIDLGTTPWLCTWRLAMKVWPDAPGHKNQVLRYWLDVPDPSSSTHAHRALYDAEVTAGIFAKILERATSEDPYEGMLKVSQSPVLLKKVNFGEHAGKLWSEVPESYLNWMLRKSDGWDEHRLYTARYWKERYAKEK